MSEKQTHNSKNKSFNKNSHHKKPINKTKSTKSVKFIANLQLSSSTEVENIKNSKQENRNINKNISESSSGESQEDYKKSTKQSTKMETKKAKESSTSEISVVAKKEVHVAKKVKVETIKEESSDSSSSDVPEVVTKKVQVLKKVKSESKKLDESSESNSSSEEASMVVKEKVNVPKMAKVQIKSVEDLSSVSSENTPSVTKKSKLVSKGEKSKSKKVEDSESNSSSSVVAKKVNVSKKTKLESNSTEDSDSSSEVPVVVNKKVNVSKKTKDEQKKIEESSSSENSIIAASTLKKRKIEIKSVSSDENTEVSEIRPSKSKKTKSELKDKFSETPIVDKKPRVSFKKNSEEEKPNSDSLNSDNEWKPKKTEEKLEKYANEENKIVVKNIPQDVSEAEIEEIFSKFGPIDDMRMPPAFEKSPSVKHRGVCFIVYKSAHSIEKAVKVTKIQNKPIEVVKAERNYKLKRNTNSVFVGNLPYDAKPEEIKKFFKSLKIEIGDIRLPRNEEGRCKGFCFMEVTGGKEKLLKTKFIFKERHLKINSAESRDGSSFEKKTGDRNFSTERRNTERSSSFERRNTERREDTGRSAPRNSKREFSKSDGDFKNQKQKKIVFENSSEN